MLAYLLTGCKIITSISLEEFFLFTVFFGVNLKIIFLRDLFFLIFGFSFFDALPAMDSKKKGQ